MIQPSHSFFRQKHIQLILGLALLQLIIALFTNTLSFTHEESMWHYIGRNWFRHGLTPYAGGIDNKSPLIFAVYGLSDWLFGINYWFPRILGTFVECIGIYYLYRIAKQLAGDRAGILAISVYGLSLLWKTTGEKLVSFTETYSTAFIIISFYKCLTAGKNKHYFISGLIAGFGFGFRCSAIFAMPAILIVALRKNITAALFFVAGVLTGALLVVAILQLSGIDIKDFLYYGFTGNFGNGSATDHNWQYKLEGFTSNFFYSELILFYPFVIGYILIKRKLDPLLIWLVCTFIGLNVLGLYARPHFKEMLPALSLTSAISIAHLTETYKVPFKGLLLIIWISFFPKTLEPFWGLKKTIHPPLLQSDTYCNQILLQADEAAEKKLGLWIKSVTGPTDLVYVAGYGARVQLYSERLSPTVYFNITQTAHAKEQLYKDLNSSATSVIAVPAFITYKSFVDKDVRDFVEDLLAKDYMFDKCMFGYNIFKKKV